MKLYRYVIFCCVLFSIVVDSNHTGLESAPDEDTLSSAYTQELTAFRYGDGLTQQTLNCRPQKNI